MNLSKLEEGGYVNQFYLGMPDDEQYYNYLKNNSILNGLTLFKVGGGEVAHPIIEESTSSVQTNTLRLQEMEVTGSVIKNIEKYTIEEYQDKRNFHQLCQQYFNKLDEEFQQSFEINKKSL